MNDGKRDLRPLFDPPSVDPRSVERSCEVGGQWFARGALRGERQRAVYLVNPGGGEILGRPAYRGPGSVDRLDLAELMARLSKHEPQLQLAA